MQHQKHNKLSKPATGHFGRREWAITGTACHTIQTLARALAGGLGPSFRIAWVDADHKGASNAEAPGFAFTYTDKIQFHRFDALEKLNPWQHRARFNETDLVLINGNHFAGARQIVALDRRKFDSLQRKADRLTQVDFFLGDAADPNFATPSELPEALKQQLPNWAGLPVLDLRDIEGMVAFLKPFLAAPPLQALILTGGKSTRMGQDKATLDYHGQPQWKQVRNLLQTAGIDRISLSCRADQVESYGTEAVIADTFLDLGPMGAILSAFRHNPDAAWLVVACDLPLLDAAALRYLVQHRRPSAVATAFRQPLPPDADNAVKPAGFPEPLIAVWEPKSYPVLLQFLAQGISCPRKALINSDTHLLDAPDPQVLHNANTPEEREQMLRILQAPAQA